MVFLEYGFVSNKKYNVMINDKIKMIEKFVIWFKRRKLVMSSRMIFIICLIGIV